MKRNSHSGSGAFTAFVTGRVQGVGFRYSTCREATRLGLKGYVQNCMDGSVKVVAEGSTFKLERLASWLSKGPTGSYVSHVRFENYSATNYYHGFNIEY